MERHYYLLKVGAIVLAVAVMAFTSADSSRVSHAVVHAGYSAPAQIEAATWHATAALARGVVHLVGLCSIWP